MADLRHIVATTLRQIVATALRIDEAAQITTFGQLCALVGRKLESAPA